MDAERALDAEPVAAHAARRCHTTSAQLCLVQAQTLLLTGPIDAIDGYLADAERGLQQGSDGVDAEWLRGEIAAIRATIASFAGDVPQTIELCRQALEHLAPEHRASRTLVAHNLAVAYRFQGDIRQAHQAFHDSIRLGEQAGASYLVLDDITDLAIVQALGGQLAAALSTVKHGLQRARELKQERSPATAVVHIQLGALLRERNDLQLALEQVQDGIELAALGGNTDVLLYGYITGASIQAALGHPHDALQLMDQALHLAHQYKVARWIARVSANYARLSLAVGNLRFASAWAAERTSRAAAEPGELREFGDLVLARLRLTQGHVQDALTLLGRLIQTAEDCGLFGRVIEMQALHAVALSRQGRFEPAHRALDQALQIAEPEPYVRVFVDEGVPMATLLRQFRTTGSRAAHVEQLLAAFPNSVIQQLPDAEQPAAPSGSQIGTAQSRMIVEPLTEREQDVLRLLAAGLSNPAIAQHFVVSVNTVKTQVKSIFSKLAVHSRDEAIAKARRLRLL